MAGVPIRMGLREANQQFSAAIRAVKAGRSVLLTERGRPIAMIRPIPDEDDDAVRTRLEQAGLLKKAEVDGPLPPFRPVSYSGPPIEDVIRAERDEP